MGGQGRKIFFLLFLPFLSARVVAQQPRDAGPQIATVSVSGRVVSAETGEPIRNARVAARNATRNIPAVMSGSDGRWIIARLTPGTYTLVASKPGYVRTDLDLSSDTPPYRVEITEPGNVRDVQIRLGRAAAISGRVTDQFGEPVAVAAVVAEAMVKGEPRILKGVMTDDRGNYRVGGLPPGNVFVSVRAFPDDFFMAGIPAVARAGESFGGMGVFVDAAGVPFERRFSSDMAPRLFYPGAVARDQAQPIAIRPGDEQPGIDLTIVRPRALLTRMANLRPATPLPEAAGTIGGRIVGGDGRPLPRARVRLVERSKFEAARIAQTDNDGRYEFTNVRPGGYLVSASKPGYLTVGYGQKEPSTSGERVWVDDRAVVDHIDIALPRHGVITGRVLDENGDPVEDARVRLLHSRFVGGRRRLVDVEGIAGPTLTNDQGAYRIYNVPPGFVVVRADVAAADTDDAPGYLPTYFPGTTNASSGAAVRVDVARETTGIDIMLQPGRTARISGRALDSHGQPWSGALTLTPSERSHAVETNSMGARIDPGGAFEFSNVTPGDYVIREARARRNPHSESEFGAAFVTVTGPDVTGAFVQASVGATVTGRITLAGNGDVNKADIDLSAIALDPDVSPAGTGAVASADIHDDWTFELHGINGPRRLRLVSAPAGWCLKGIFSGGADITDALVDFARTPSSDLEVVLTDRITRLVADATDTHGQHIADYAVVVFSVDRDRWHEDSRFVRAATSSRDGIVRLEGIPPGEYFVAAVERLAGGLEEEDWRDPALLEALAAHATRVMLTEGVTSTVSLKADLR